MTNEQRVYNLKLKLQADTGELKTLKKELTDLEKNTHSLQEGVSKLQHLKSTSKKGMFQEDILLSDELNAKLKELTLHYNVLNAAKADAKGTAKQKIAIELTKKSIEMDKLLTAEILKKKRALNQNAVAQRQATDAERDAIAVAKRRERSLDSEVRSLNRLKHKTKETATATRMLDKYVSQLGAGFAANDLVRHIRRLESMAVGIYAIKSAWDATLGAGLEYSVEMEQINLKLKGILGSSATMETTTGRTITNLTEKWKIADQMASKLKAGMKEVAIDTGTAMRDAGRIMSAILPQSLAAGASLKEITEMTKGFTVALSTGNLTIKEAVNSLDNFVSGEAKASELVNYMKTLGINMKELKSLKGHEAIDQIIEVLKRLDPVTADFKKSFTGIKSMLTAQWGATMADAVKPYEDGMKRVMKSTTAMVKDHNAEIIAGSRLFLQEVGEVWTWLKAKVTPILKVYGGLMLEAIGTTASFMNGAIKLGTAIFDMGIKLAKGTINLINLSTGADIGADSFKKLISVLIGMKLVSSITKMVIGLTRAIIMLSGTSVVFKALWGGTKLLAGGFLALSGIIYPSIVTPTKDAATATNTLLGAMILKVKSVGTAFGKLWKMAKATAMSIATLGLGSTLGVSAGLAAGGAGAVVGIGLAKAVTGSMNDIDILRGHTKGLDTVTKATDALNAAKQKAIELNAEKNGDTTFLQSIGISRKRSPKELSNDLHSISRSIVTYQKVRDRLVAGGGKLEKGIDLTDIDSISAGIKAKIDGVKSIYSDMKSGKTGDLFSTLFGDSNKFMNDFNAMMNVVKKELSEISLDVPLEEQLTFNPADDDKDDTKAIAKAKKKAERLAKAKMRQLNVFNAAYEKALHGNKAGEIEKLKQKRDQFLKDGMDNIKVAEWYKKAVANVNKKYDEREAKAFGTASRKHNTALVKAKKAQLKITREFADDIAKASLSEEGYDIYKLKEQRAKYLKDKVDKLEVDKWYEIAKDKVHKDYADKRQKTLNTALKSYYNASGNELKVFAMETNQTLTQLAKDGLTGDQLSVVYNKMWKDYNKVSRDALKEYYSANKDELKVFTMETNETLEQLANAGLNGDQLSVIYNKLWKEFRHNAKESFSTLKELGLDFADNLKESLAQALSGLSTTFANTGKIDVEGTVNTMYDSASNYLKQQNDPYAKTAGYAMDLLKGIVGDAGPEPIDLFNDPSKSIESGIATLASFAKPGYDHSMSMANYLKHIDINILAMAKGMNGVDVGALTGENANTHSTTWYGQKTSLMSAGIHINQQSLADLANVNRAKVGTFETIDESSWGGLRHKSKRYDKEDQALSIAFAKTLAPMVDSMEEMVRFGGGGSFDARNYQMTVGDLKLDGKDEAERSKIIQEYIASVGDSIIRSELPMLEEFRKADEGIYQTGIRMITAYEEADKLLGDVGVKTKSLISMTGRGYELTAKELVRQSIRDKETYQVETRSGKLKHSQWGDYWDSKLVDKTSEIGLYVLSLNDTAEATTKAYKSLKDFNSTMQVLDLGEFDRSMLKLISGGIGGLTAGLEGYVNSYYGEDEKKAVGVKIANKDLASIGVTLPKTTSEFRKLVDSFSVSGSNTDLSKWGYLIDHSADYFQLLDDDLGKQRELLKETDNSREKEKDYLEYRLKNTQSEYQRAKGIQAAMLQADTLTGQWKQHYAEAIMTADSQYNTKDNSIASMEQFLSVNKEYGSGYADYAQQKFVEQSLLQLGGGTIVQEVTDVKQTEATMKLVDEVAIMGAKIEELNMEMNRGKDAFGTTPVTIVADNTK